MKNLIISFTDEGKQLGEKISCFLQADHLISSEFKGSIRKVVGESWRNLDSIIFISSTGIAVRYIKDYIISKDVDPAVVVIDDLGINVISLLSGHLGGGNELTRFLAKELDAYPVISTATDNRGIESVDVYSKKHNLLIEDIKDIKAISMLMLKGRKLGFYSEQVFPLIKYQHLKVLDKFQELSDIEGLIIISNKLIDKIMLPKIFLRPKNIVIGLGCRKGMPKERIIEAIKEELKRLNLSKYSLAKIGTVEAKKNEKGIFEAAEYFDIEVEIFSNEEIKKVENLFEKSQFVKDTIGVYSVSEPACHLLGGELISRKEKYNGITISVGEIKL